MRFLKTITIAGLALCLASCAYINGDKSMIKNRDVDYLKATSVPTLKVPPGLSSDSIQPHYPVPEKNYPDSFKKPSLVPPELE